MKAIIAPSLLSGDFAQLGVECDRMLAARADWLHVDVMDGHFVPNLTIGVPVLRSLRKHAKDAFLDCHLMVDNPEKWVNDFAKAGASSFTFHIEATKDAVALIKAIHEAGMRAGVAVKPGTSVQQAEPYLDSVDLLLIMTVEPGFGGQLMMPECLSKVEHVRQKYPHLNIQVDGGITTENVSLAAKSGANVIVAGTSIFGAPDAAAAIATMHGVLRSHGFK